MIDVPVVGASRRVLQAGVAVGAMAYLVLTGKGETTRNDPALPEGTLIYPDLDAVAAELTP